MSSRVNHVWLVLAAAITLSPLFLFNNCGGPLKANVSGLKSSGSAQSEVDPGQTSVNALSCSFNGQTVAHGSPVTAYASSTVPSGNVCQSETRVCNNGSLSGSFAYSQCGVNQAAACLLGSNVTVPSGNSVTAYQNSSVPFGQTCASETVTCQNGMLSGSFRYPTCTVSPQTVPADTLAEVRVLLWSETVANYGNPCPSGWIASTSAPYNDSVVHPEWNRFGVCLRPYTSGDTEVITSFYVGGQNQACPSGMSKAGDLITYIPNGTMPSDQSVAKSPLCVKKEPAGSASRFVYMLSYKKDPSFVDCGGYDYCQYWH